MESKYEKEQRQRREDIENAKRPHYYYDIKSQSYIEEQTRVHTLESAALILEALGYEAYSCQLYYVIADDENITIPSLNMIRSERDIVVPNNIPEEQIWDSYYYYWGAEIRVFPIPPPHSANKPLPINDDNWAETLLIQKDSNSSSNSFFDLLCDLGLQTQSTPSNKNKLTFSEKIEDTTHRHILSTDEYVKTVSDSDDLLNHEGTIPKEIADLIIKSFYAGVEHGRESYITKHHDMIFTGRKIKENLRINSITSNRFRDILHSYIKDNPQVKIKNITGTEVAQYIRNSENTVWIQLLDDNLEKPRNPLRSGSLNGVIRRYKKKHSQDS